MWLRMFMWKKKHLLKTNNFPQGRLFLVQIQLTLYLHEKQYQKVHNF